MQYVKRNSEFSGQPPIDFVDPNPKPDQKKPNLPLDSPLNPLQIKIKIKSETNSPQKPANNLEAFGKAGDRENRSLVMDRIDEEVSHNGITANDRGGMPKHRKSGSKLLDKYQLIKSKILDMVNFTETLYQKLQAEQDELKSKNPNSKDHHGSIPKNVPVPHRTSNQEAVVFLFHKDWNLVINMMIGTYKAVKAVWDSDDHIITAKDYKVKDVFQLSYYRSIEQQAQLKGTCHFHHYAPYIFADIRKAFGIDDEKVNCGSPVPQLHRKRVAGEQLDQRPAE